MLNDEIKRALHFLGEVLSKPDDAGYYYALADATEEIQRLAKEYYLLLTKTTED